MQIFSLSASAGYTNLLTLGFYYPGQGVSSGPVYAPGGTLYGTLYDSASLVDGLAYSLLNGVYTIQGEFSGSVPPRSGASPDAQPIISRDGNLVGTTATSGTCSYCGAIWLSIPSQ